MTRWLLGTLTVVVVTLADAALRAQTPAPAPPTQSPASPSSAQAPAQTPTPNADGVYPIGGAVAPPRVQREVKPSYTPEAMRNRIQGSVRLQAIVERNGTVSGIQVVRSLDSQFGLDQAAVNALKQWQFQPGTLADGTPVRVLINVELTFTLRSGPVTQAWPEGFPTATSLPGAVEEAAETQGLRLKISRPAAWSVTRGGSPSLLVEFHSADGSESVGVSSSDTPAFDLSGLAPDAQAQRLAEQMRVFQGALQAEAFAAGQVQASPDVLWVWSAFRLPNVSEVPGVAANGPIGEGRVWLFSRAANGKVMLVQCVLMLPRDVEPATLTSRVQQATADFAPIIKSITVEAITP